jgi:ribosomal protein S18 acetylase RimI-like enzyme
MSDDAVVTFAGGTRATIRLARVADAQALVALDRRLAADGDGMVQSVAQIRSIEEQRARIDAMYRDMSAGKATCSVVAEVDGQIVGSADLKQHEPERCRHVGILAVGVHVEFRRRRIARTLLEQLIDHARRSGLIRLELYVRADNVRAQRLYESLGFRHEGMRQRFVRLDDGSFVDDWIYARFV